MAERKHMAVEVFRQEGWMLEANRRFFHPRGLALEARIMKGDWTPERIAKSEWMQARLYDVEQTLAEANLTEGPNEDPVDVVPIALAICQRLWPKGHQMLSGVQDVRDDPEGMVFGEEDDIEDKRRAAAVGDHARRQHFEARYKLFGIPESIATQIVDPDIEPIDWVYTPRAADDG